MRALRYDGPAKGISLHRDAAEPVLADGEALIRPVRAAIGPADLVFERQRPALPAITLGRQFVGVVEAVAGHSGRSKHPLQGKRVVGGANIPCGVCELCRRGLSMHCAARMVLGMRGRDGCLADRFVLPVKSLIGIPDHVDDDAAVFSEPLAAALHAAGQLRLEGKPYVTVLGDNVHGLLCSQVMARLNASVRVLGRDERRLELASKWGIKHRLEGEAGRRADQDVVIDCTGTTEGFAVALQMVRPRGKVVVKSPLLPVMAGVPAMDASAIAQNEIEVIGSRCGQLSEAVAVLSRGDVDVISLIASRDKLDRGAEALRAAAKADSLSVVIEI